ncbi:metal transporter [Streptomyces swartbergensis]|uniref:metal transporter n=1 Tax=Streptomyces swartbergensis TaxID=487165 RepID=UPI0038057F95
MMSSIGLGVVFALGIAFTTFMLMDSWGGASWVFGTVVSIIVGGLALMRERRKLPTAAAGLAVTAVAVVVSLAAGDDLPQEPAPVTALAMAVLVGSAIRTLPVGQAAGIAAGSVVVTGVTWAHGWTGVTNLATMATVAALVMGSTLRGLDRKQRANSPTQGSWANPPQS